nr:hypothetical protein [Candidatus Sigynarchaeota archaeon]
MAFIDDLLNLLNFAYFILAPFVFFAGFNLARKGLQKVNKIEGEPFRAFDWLVSIMFGILFMVAVVFCINLAVDFLITTTGINIQIQPVGSYLLVIALGVLVLYPVWEMFYLARPSSDSVTDYHRFLEAKFINKARGRGAYVVSLLLLIATYGVPIIGMSFIPGFNLPRALFLWIIIVPLIFLNYFAAAGTVGNIVKTSYTALASNKAYPGIKQFQT